MTETSNLSKGRTARIDLRVPTETKYPVQRAADIEGKSLTKFAESTLVRQAAEVVSANETTVLSRRDAELFLVLLGEDSKPNDALPAAINKYLEMGFPKANANN